MIFQVVMKTVYEIVALPMTMRFVKRVERLEAEATKASRTPIFES